MFSSISWTLSKHLQPYLFHEIICLGIVVLLTVQSIKIKQQQHNLPMPLLIFVKLLKNILPQE